MDVLMQATSPGLAHRLCMYFRPKENSEVQRRVFSALGGGGLVAANARHLLENSNSSSAGSSSSLVALEGLLRSPPEVHA